MISKREAERQLEYSQIKIESLEERLIASNDDKEKLLLQIVNLQEALISIKAPEAYRDQKIAEEDEKRTPISEEKLERNRITQEVTTEYMNSLEGPLFRTPDDLDDLLRTSIIADLDVAGKSLHGDNES